MEFGKQKNVCRWTKCKKAIILNTLLCIFYIFTMGKLSFTYGKEAGHIRPPAEVASSGKIHQVMKETHRKKEDVDQRYVEVYLQNKELQKELEQYRKICSTYCNSGERLQSLTEKLLVLEKVQRQEKDNQKVKEELVALRSRLICLIQNMNLDEQSRKRLLEEFDQSLQAILQILSKKEQEFKETQGEIKILAINKELEVAVVNCGSLEGIKPGMLLTSTELEKDPVTLQVIEVRPSVSAVVIQSGRIKDLYPDLKLKLGK